MCWFLISVYSKRYASNLALNKILLFSIVFITALPISFNEYFTSGVLAYDIVSIAKIYIVSLALIFFINMSTLRIFIVLSVLSCILFWVYQIYVLGLINRPNTYSASSSVFLIHVFGLMYLANLNEKKTIAKKYLPTYHKALIIFCGMLSGTGKIVLFFPMLLNLRFSFFRLPIKPRESFR